MAALKAMLFYSGVIAKGTDLEHQIYLVPKGVKVTFSIVPLRVPEELLNHPANYKNGARRNAGKERKKKKIRPSRP